MLIKALIFSWYLACTINFGFCDGEIPQNPSSNIEDKLEGLCYFLLSIAFTLVFQDYIRENRSVEVLSRKLADATISPILDVNKNTDLDKVLAILKGIPPRTEEALPDLIKWASNLPESDFELLRQYYTKNENNSLFDASLLDFIWEIKKDSSTYYSIMEGSISNDAILLCFLLLCLFYYLIYLLLKKNYKNSD